MIKLGQMVLKGVNKIVHMVKGSQLEYTIQKSGHMVLKGVNWVHNTKIRSNGLERSHLGTQCIKSGHMVLKGVN